jgi:hypothetical protein
MENKDLEKRVANLEKFHIWGFVGLGLVLIGIYAYRRSRN